MVTNKQTTNQVIPVQACSWPVGRQSFAIVIMKTFPFLVISSPQTSCNLGLIWYRNARRQCCKLLFHIFISCSVLETLFSTSRLFFFLSSFSLASICLSLLKPYCWRSSSSKNPPWMLSRPRLRQLLVSLYSTRTIYFWTYFLWTTYYDISWGSVSAHVVL